MKILVSDPLAPEALERLKAAQGVAVDVKTEMTPEELVGAIGEYDAIVVRSATKVTGDVVAAGKNLKVIGRAGIGLDNIDVKAAEKAGIKVVNTPAASSISVAELALAHMFALSRQIPKGTAGLKAGKWEKKALKGVELYNKTLGIIGTGRIGRELAKRAAALGMTVLGYDPYITQADLGDVQVKLVPLDELLEKSDFISLHLPKTEETTHLLGQREFAGIQVKRDRSDNLIWVAAGLLLLGLGITFYVPRRRLWAKITGDRTYLAGVAGYRVNFRREMAKLGVEAGSPDAMEEEEQDGSA